jgi:alanyl-tRNA synthetase
VISGERSIGSGVRRIEALTGAGADAHLRARVDLLDRAVEAAGAVSAEALPERIAALQGELKDARRKADRAPKEAMFSKRDQFDGVDLVRYATEFDDIEKMKSYARYLRDANPEAVIALGLDADEPQVFVTVPTSLVERGISAGELVRRAVVPIDGKGGGRHEMAQGRGTKREGLPDAMEAIATATREAVEHTA